MSDAIIVILAGGDSYRYKKTLGVDGSNFSQSDKLLSLRANVPLIKFVTEELRDLGDLLIVTRGERKLDKFSDLLNIKNQSCSKERMTVIKEDRNEAIGPLGGIYTALKYTMSYQIRPLLILPGDLPYLNKKIVADFLQKGSQSKSFKIVSLVHSNGQAENLSMIINSNKVLESVESLICAGLYRVSSLIRLVSKKRFINSSYLKNDSFNCSISQVFKDIDNVHFNSDKKVVSQRKKYADIIKVPFIDYDDNVEMKKDPSELFNQFLTWKKETSKLNSQNEISSITRILSKEAELYRDKGLFSLSLHCLLDAYKLKNEPQIAEQIKNLVERLEYQETNVI